MKSIVEQNEAGMIIFYCFMVIVVLALLAIIFVPQDGGNNNVYEKGLQDEEIFTGSFNGWGSRKYISNE